MFFWHKLGIAEFLAATTWTRVFDHVRQKIVEFLNRLIDIDVAGFR